MARVVYDEVTKRFGEVTALRDFSLHIDDGEFMVLVGPSGSGKTTALRLLAGPRGGHRGEIRVGDRVVNRLAPRDRDIAMVFQDYALYPQKSVYDNLAFGLRMRKMPRGDRPTRPPRRRDARHRGAAPAQAACPAGGQRQQVALGRRSCASRRRS